ncbi:hypothetical protein GWC95_06100 [Sediminibacterium roseum]|uniref:Uncharacterized protein n=1 Tax=Sediminibacterium roseum TaxID=1978412 RepID=A0ABW9ZQV4_9BACT|nr:hypothetical protein [Sediminibacterium roseum]NCI49487.1 hypothetical protein [Sediminibacterium roseum]
MSKNYCQNMNFILSPESLEKIKAALDTGDYNSLVLSLAVDDDAKVFVTVAPSLISEEQQQNAIVKVLKFSPDDPEEAIPNPPGAHNTNHVVLDGKNFTIITYSEEASAKWKEYFK